MTSNDQQHWLAGGGMLKLAKIKSENITVPLHFSVFVQQKYDDICNMIKDCFKRRECVRWYAFSALETVFNHASATLPHTIQLDMIWPQGKREGKGGKENKINFWLQLDWVYSYRLSHLEPAQTTPELPDRGGGTRGKRALSRCKEGP